MKTSSAPIAAVTAAKFDELKKAFPKCRIESDYGTYEPKP